MDADKLIYAYYRSAIDSNRKQHVGAELEFPIITPDNTPISREAICAAFAALTQYGLQVTSKSAEGLPFCALDQSGNMICFDTCFENLEFSLASNPSLLQLHCRFHKLLQAVQTALQKHSCSLAGIAYNFCLGARKPVLLPDAITIAESKLQKQNNYPVLFCSISSEQIHFNTTVTEAPELIELLTRLDWLVILLFANSPGTKGNRQFDSLRSVLYQDSLFHKLKIAGSADVKAASLADALCGYSEACQYKRHRHGHLETIPPVPARIYYAQPQYEAREADVADLDIMLSAVITDHGTVEYRTPCAQPFTAALCPAAFSLGLRASLQEALNLVRNFHALWQLPEPEVCCQAAAQGNFTFVPRDAVSDYAQALLTLSGKALQQRGYGEEILLQPLIKREDIFCNPARQFRHRVRAVGLQQALYERTATSIGNDSL